MPLLNNGKIVQDSWTVLNNELPDPLPQAAILIPFSNLPTVLENRKSNYPIGVIFPSDADIGLLKPYLDRLKLIALVFAGFKDGRAFSQARKIREQLKYKDELRAIGHILPDQYQFLIRTGFSTVSIPETANLATWEKAMRNFDIAYQPALGKEKRLQGLHWKL